MTGKAISTRHFWLGLALFMPAPATAAPPPRDAATCFANLAQTRGYSLGEPVHATPTPDGKSVLYLRSLSRDTRLHLYEYDIASHTERELAKPDAAPEHLSVEEKARRERARMTLTGITSFALSQDGSTLLVGEADRLTRIARPSGAASSVPGTGWIGPRLSPDGKFLAAVRDNDLHVVDLASGHDVQLTHGGTETLTHGLAEFAAAEELDRPDGTWWSPDSSRLVFEEADSSGVEKHYIADPEHPSSQPIEFRYPRAGTANAKIRLGILPRAGGTPVWIDWNHDSLPYVARVIWQKQGPLTLVLLNRAQTVEQIVRVDPDTGRTSPILTETDQAWIDLSPMIVRNATAQSDLPRFLADGSGFLWAAQRDAGWQLELHRMDGSLARVLAPAALHFDALDDVDDRTGTVTFTASPDRLGSGIYKVQLSGAAPVPLATAAGLHEADFGEGHAVLTDQTSGADGSAATTVLSADGTRLGVIPSVAETPPEIPSVQYLTVGARGLDAMVIRPAGMRKGGHYPVILSVYAGPTVKVVHRAPRDYLENSCLADQGFIVVSVDGRGTPGRDSAFEHATKGDLIDLPLQDQIDGVTALARIVPEMDMSRVGVTGWSFGGYFTAMATIRRPDIFKAGVAGAPVVDFADYDTAYTERYLSTPQQAPAAYRVSNVLTYASGLSRPLLLMHGLTDDNVYFENTVKLSQALLASGKPYRLLLLPGTHLLPDPLIRQRVDEARYSFLANALR
jgi:dipeptidyl-peptidase-4